VTGAVHGAKFHGRVRIPQRFADDYSTIASTIATVVSVTGLADAQQHVAFELGRPGEAGPPLVRRHSECLTGDVFGSQRCDCGPRRREAVERIANHGGLVFRPAQVADGLAARLDGLPVSR
jgi:GTP cyclohydrolase II